MQFMYFYLLLRLKYEELAMYIMEILYKQIVGKIASRFFLFIRSVKHGKIFESYITKILNNIKSNH